MGNPSSSQCYKDFSQKLDVRFHKSRKQNVERGPSSSNKLLVGDCDRLSALHQEIQQQILSFLPITDAAKTGFMSRMWRATWNSLPKLIFDYSQFPGMESVSSKLHSFVRFVDQTLACHDESDVKVFELLLWPFYECYLFIQTSWITFSIQHNVKKLVLCGRMDKVHKIPNCLYSCQSLVKLELAIQDFVVTWPETFTLPNLRKLNFKFLVLSDQTCGNDLFSHFPALEKLSIMLCDMTSYKILRVTVSRLTEFVMCSCPGMEGCSLSLQTPCLSKFIYVCDAATETKLVPTHLFGLVISGRRFDVQCKSINDLISSVIKLTRELFKAHYLVFSHLLVQLLSMSHDLPRQLAFDIFCNLRSLNIGLSQGMRSIRTVMLLLSRCPNLVKVYLEIESPMREPMVLPDLDQEMMNDGSEDGFCKLTSIVIKNFEGDDTELMLVRLLLANAYQLRLMRIDMNILMVRNDMKQKIEKILGYEKASASADVIFD